ncbi:hypothetical protein F3Y22_tig00110551pilonHSYRG00270 [Hibiscus syriacus]|uniref:Uncharacterized protein n=1 Tax=Hibiscus syriacus TaxID=106335 RepID=A0A6A3A970_HIBSY|nr:hypothetical protein F3Y22_tig00110551pilonHSYRG00270 [Hibiscus syriacus]
MVESRDRLIRAVDLAHVFARRRSGTLGIFSDEARELLLSPVRQSRLTGGGRHGEAVLAPRVPLFDMDGLFTDLRPWEKRILLSQAMEGAEGRAVCYRLGIPELLSIISLLFSGKNENEFAVSIYRNAIERRARIGGSQGLTIPEDERGFSSNVSSFGAQLEQNFLTPASTPRLKSHPLSVRKVSKILLVGTNMNAEESELLTPQKKLLNSIDTVGKAVMRNSRN